MPLRQWMLRITAYADRLEKDLEGLDWSEGIKALQRNWIGRSTGAEVDFDLPDTEKVTVRIRGVDGPVARAEFVEDTDMRAADGLHDAAGYAVRRNVHGDRARASARRRLTTPEQAKQVKAYREQAARKSDLDRTELAKEKTGVFTGSYAINPVNGEPVPIWIADYVLISYGTGAIMAVPAHDERDFEFAQQFGLPIKAVVDPGDAVSPSERDEVLAGKRCFAGDGVAINSEQVQRPDDGRVQEEDHRRSRRASASAARP